MDDLISRLDSELDPTLVSAVRLDEPLAPYTTLRVGGPADLFFLARNADDLASVVAAAQRTAIPYFLLGGGSNICVSDKGFRGLVILNLAESCKIGTTTHADTGHNLMSLFLKTAQAGLSGLEFAVGIPGSVGGALVSNAGAYRQNIDAIVRELDVVESGIRRQVGPEWMEFSYRDTRLRKPDREPAAVVSVTLELTPAPRRDILARARDNQRQRIFKQPWNPSAGSFFKNVTNAELAQVVPDLPRGLREAGVVPAGFLSQACGCKGLKIGGAQITGRHGNIFVNRGGATASDFRRLAGTVRRRVRESYCVELEEEVLYTGDWVGWSEESPDSEAAA
jgi:UDP-N-acetylmuramate dehydrogenase